MMCDYVETLEKAVEVFGERIQSEIAIEEMAELTKEIVKNFRGNDNVQNIIEEIADVQIMLDQLKIMFDCQVEVQWSMEEKIERLNNRINKVAIKKES